MRRGGGGGGALAGALSRHGDLLWDEESSLDVLH